MYFLPSWSHERDYLHWVTIIIYITVCVAGWEHLSIVQKFHGTFQQFLWLLALQVYLWFCFICRKLHGVPDFHGMGGHCAPIVMNVHFGQLYFLHFWLLRKWDNISEVVSLFYPSCVLEWESYYIFSRTTLMKCYLTVSFSAWR